MKLSSVAATRRLIPATLKPSLLTLLIDTPMPSSTSIGLLSAPRWVPHIYVISILPVTIEILLHTQSNSEQELIDPNHTGSSRSTKWRRQWRTVQQP